MSTTEKTSQMPRPKKNPESSEPPTMAVKIDRTVGKKAQLIATDLGVDLASYISDALRGVVQRDWAKMLKRAEGEAGEKGAG